jgi:hypothetical protein
MVEVGAQLDFWRRRQMRRVSHSARFMSGWLACVTVAFWALVFIAGIGPAHAAEAAQRACGASSSSSSGTSTQASKGSARISLSTPRGVAGTQVIVSGAGWPSGQRVVISVANLTDEHDGVNGTGWLSRATVGADGAFTTPTFGFPYAVCGVRPKAGTTASIVAATEDNSVRVIAPFALAQTPTLEVATPQRLTPLPREATSVGVTGSDWIPGASVSLVAARLDTIADAEGNQTQTASPFPRAQPIRVTADARGEISANVPIPPGLPPGTAVDISATATSHSYGTLVINLYAEALIPAPVPPTWDLSATRGQPGMTLTVTGDHWWPTDNISVEYCRTEAAQPTALGMRCNLGPQGLVSTGYAAQLVEAVADASGHFTASVTLPAKAKTGAIIIQARLPGGSARADVYFASQEFTLTPPATSAQSLVTRWRDWWTQALVGVLLLGAALFVFWPRITRIIMRRTAAPTPLGQPSHEQGD